MLKWQTHWMLALSGVSFWLAMWERQSLSRMAGKLQLVPEEPQHC